MLIENIELTMSHVGLGNLNEYALLLLFGNAHSHHLVINREVQPDAIKNNKGQTLYPAYFMTRLQVPPHRLLSSYKLWDKVSVGVDVASFGETILESSYLCGPAGDVPEDPAAWDCENLPCMKANSLLIVDVGETGGFTREVSIPVKETFAELPKLKKAPGAILESQKIRGGGFGLAEINLCTREPICLTVPFDQDAAPGHAIVFANFSRIMDRAETCLLLDLLKPGLPASVLSNFALLERQTYYYGNCFAGEELRIYISGRFAECAHDFHGSSLQSISVALLEYQVEIYIRRNNNLLAMARVKKLLSLPTASQYIIPDIKRVISNIQA